MPATSGAGRPTIKLSSSQKIPAPKLYANDFEGFFKEHQYRLLELVTKITGHASPVVAESPDEGEDLPSSIAHDSELEVVEVD
ncbi:hypothetical protein [Desulfuromonas carbonis]